MDHEITRRDTVLGLAGVLGGMSLGSAGARAADWTPKPPFVGRQLNAELVLQINVKLGPIEDMGAGADGHRINYPIVGGYFSGRGLKGEVIPGGADMSVRRNDGVTLIEALYRLKTDDEQVLIIDNAGIFRPNAVGRKKLAAGEELLERDYYCLTSPKFKTPPGKYNWLTEHIFVGTIDDVSEQEVLIGCYLMTQVG
ncbi:DUF3237 family protein [Parahaliea maris]|uniref:DUF3237 family protein n=1 Tax=Parahaliea maris TaxID=2716870 RepID=A0A5C8ZTR8_9GAMM|nr:DUF3237 family protein [Parahaliea maris]TXS91893.1 DUF3237 family protein [Parahaliea maris]